MFVDFYNNFNFLKKDPYHKLFDEINEKSRAANVDVESLINLANSVQKDSQRNVVFKKIVEELLSYNHVAEAELVLQSLSQSLGKSRLRRPSFPTLSDGKIKEIPENTLTAMIEKIKKKNIRDPGRGSIAEISKHPSHDGMHKEQIIKRLPKSPLEIYKTLSVTEKLNGMKEERFFKCLFDYEYRDIAVMWLYSIPWNFTPSEVINVFFGAIEKVTTDLLLNKDCQDLMRKKNMILEYLKIFIASDVVRPEVFNDEALKEKIQKIHERFDETPLQFQWNSQEAVHVNVELPVVKAVDKLTDLFQLYSSDSSMSFSKSAIEEFAWALTYQHAVELEKIRPYEFYRAQWGKEGSTHNSPNLRNYIRLSDGLAHFIISTILDASIVQTVSKDPNCEEIVSRAKLIELYILLSQMLCQQGNLNAAFQIVVGLNSACVSRLKLVWSFVSAEKHNVFKKLVGNFSAINCGQSARAMESTFVDNDQRCLPCLNFYLGLLAGCNENVLRDKNQQMVFPMAMLDIGRLLKYLDDVRSNLHIDQISIKYKIHPISDVHKMEEDDAYALSLKLQPRMTTHSNCG